ncbi:hypothetical protein [Marinobacter sp. NFXS9]|uniref:hypothetical protein n=1 Tax=Marinobacter sp. NFXS9 TaxID=2818433 RepID=UPI0032DF2B1A
MTHIRPQIAGLLVAATLLITGCSKPTPDFDLQLTDAQLERVGQQIFRNECAAKVECLVHWNEGEAFPSLGIGHFIWYPADVEGLFVESFPQLVQYMDEQGVTLPDWLAEGDPEDAPWPNRKAYLAQQDSERVESLRQFLNRTQDVQAAFMFKRAQSALARVVDAAPEARRGTISQHIKNLSATPGGAYALIDYVNFKGEGLSPSERYQGQGWGLLQVLERMSRVDGDTPLDQFRNAAAEVLTLRAKNAPKKIERERWLPGWLKRLDTYHEFD